MIVIIGTGVNKRRMEIQGRKLVDQDNRYHTFDFPSATALHKWIGARLNNGTATTSH